MTGQKISFFLILAAFCCGNTLAHGAHSHQKRPRERSRQTILFTVVPAQEAKSAIPLTATASSHLPVHVFAMTPGVCVVTDTTLSLLAQGTCVIQTNQAGDSLFAPAPMVSQMLDIERSKTSGLFDVVRSGVVLTQSNLPKLPTSAVPSSCPFPTIRAVSPATWMAGETYQVTITGSGFRPPGISTVDCPVPWVTVRADDQSATLLNATILNSTTILVTIAVPFRSPLQVANVVLWYPPPKDEEDPALPLAPEH